MGNTDSLSYTSALSAGLAVLFLVIMVGIAVIKLLSGTVMMPRLLPDVTDLNYVLETLHCCTCSGHGICNNPDFSSIRK
ncbi:hypothetical protein RND81_14G082200 [Saponaria officinalis]|uniref:Uncharacterized protein n=1 Tax=Saponaria officinalis TaxID=3572 RepID=A0AAW1GVI2_SAPOF